MANEINETNPAEATTLADQVPIGSEEEREPTADELAKEEEELKKIGLDRGKQGMPGIQRFLNSAKLAHSSSTDEHDRRVLGVMPFVLSIARRYKDRGLDLDDLLQEGNTGVMKAAVKFDPSLGFSFLTYAVWWIRQSIIRALENQSKTIRIPVNAQETRRKISRLSRELEGQLGHRPTLEEIASRTGLSLRSIGEAFENSGTVVASVDGSAFSAGDNDDVKLLDLIPDRSARLPDEILISKEEESITALLAKLDGLTTVSKRDKQIFKLLYRLDGGLVHQDLESVGHKYGMTRQRVQQIRQSIFTKLNGASKGLLLAPGTRKLKPRRFHVRASLAFINWSPGSAKDRTEALFGLICKAFEVTPADIKGESNKDDVVWARTLMAVMMMDELGLDPAAVEEFFPRGMSAIVVRRSFETAVLDDPYMRRDTEKIRGHFRNSMETHMEPH